MPMNTNDGGFGGFGGGYGGIGGFGSQGRSFWEQFMGQGGPQQQGNEPRQPRQPKPPKGTPTTRIIKSLVITLIFAAIYFYFRVPALNIHTTSFWWFVGLCVVIFTICMVIFNRYRADTATDYIKYVKKNVAVPFWIIVGIIVLCIVGSVVGLVIFRSRAYSKLITIETADFSEDIDEIRWDRIPMLDADSANNLANRKLGELSDLVSQFTVNTASSQINYKNAPIRTAYLDYGGFFKWINNRKQGIPAYMRIDMRSQEVTVVRLQDGIKYSPSEFFSRDLMRHLRFSYPTFLFDDINFEIDEDGTPYWIASVVKKTIGLFSGTDAVGAVLLNAVTGESQYYKTADVPTWVDRVYSADLVVEQYNYYGKYHNGFWNSIFGQTDCTETTSGYNYIAQDDDVWMYTGVTSVTGDRGNIGFILVNQRTKTAHYYSCAGAQETSAMSSAEGAVQQFSYRATFPLLLNIADEPTYFMALKDEAGLVKQYAMVNVQQYQIVATGASLAACQQNYKELLLQNGIVAQEDVGEIAEDPEEAAKEEITGKIEEIRSANIGGNTVYYFRLDQEKDKYFTVNAKDYPLAVILDEGDTVTLKYIAADGKLQEAELAE